MARVNNAAVSGLSGKHVSMTLAAVQTHAHTMHTPRGPGEDMQTLPQCGHWLRRAVGVSDTATEALVCAAQQCDAIEAMVDRGVLT